MPFKLTIVTPARPVFDQEVESVVLPGSEGDFGVLEQHERFLAPLRTGEAQIVSRKGAAPIWAAIAGGFADVSGERVVVLADACELATEIDVARAESARARAERSIKEVQAGAEDASRLELYEAALMRAIIRIQVSRKAV